VSQTTKDVHLKPETLQAFELYIRKAEDGNGANAGSRASLFSLELKS